MPSFHLGQQRKAIRNRLRIPTSWGQVKASTQESGFFLGNGHRSAHLSGQLSAFTSKRENTIGIDDENILLAW